MTGVSLLGRLGRDSTRGRSRSLIAGAVCVVLVAVVGCGRGPFPATLVPSTDEVTPSGPDETPTATTASSASRPLPTASDRTPTSSGHGTCLASQFSLGSVSSAPGFGALGWRTMYVRQEVRNMGPRCTIEAASTMFVAPATGGYAEVGVQDAGTSPHNDIGLAENFVIVLASWWPELPERTPPPCDHPIFNVVRAGVPVASGLLEIQLGTVLSQVCTSPATLSLAWQPK